jgi:hypothetical protein
MGGLAAPKVIGHFDLTGIDGITIRTFNVKIRAMPEKLES